MGGWVISCAAVPASLDSSPTALLVLIQARFNIDRFLASLPRASGLETPTTNGPKIAEKTPKWPQCLQSDFGNHLHQNYAPLAVVLSCHMNSLRKF